ncbi:hypothetical protein LY76DRAFT_305355 [Colletotrichum caudatum]|nr:hypothetical protein LY76DRAFT_305355 [Colletotrichum caudatum]
MITSTSVTPFLFNLARPRTRATLVNGHHRQYVKPRPSSDSTRLLPTFRRPKFVRVCIQAMVEVKSDSAVALRYRGFYTVLRH